VNVADPQFSTPDLTAMVRRAVGSLAQAGSMLPVLGEVRGLLDRKVPVLNVSLADILHIDDKMQSYRADTNTSALDDLVANAARHGIFFDLSADHISGELSDMLQGKPVDLAHFTRTYTLEKEVSGQTPIFGASLLGVAGATLNFTYHIGGELDLVVTFGLTTQGFWVGSGTGLHFQGGAGAGMDLTASILGITVGEADGSLDLSVKGDVSVVGAAQSGGKIPLSDLTNDFLNHLQVDVQAGVTGHLHIDVPFYQVNRTYNLANLIDYHHGPGQQATGKSDAETAFADGSTADKHAFTWAQNADGRQEAFALNAGGQVVHRYERPDGQGRSGWELLLRPDQFGDTDPAGRRGLAVSTDARGLLQVFVIDGSGQVFVRSQDVEGGHTEWRVGWTRVGRTSTPP
jgi:hypothetical protein